MLAAVIGASQAGHAQSIEMMPGLTSAATVASLPLSAICARYQPQRPAFRGGNDPARRRQPALPVVDTTGTLPGTGASWVACGARGSVRLVWR